MSYLDDPSYKGGKVVDARLRSIYPGGRKEISKHSYIDPYEAFSYRVHGAENADEKRRDACGVIRGQSKEELTLEAFAHLALLLFIAQDGNFEGKEAKGWQEAVGIFGVSLFAQAFPELAGAGRSITMTSGLNVDNRRCDEQFYLHFFFEP